MFLNIRIEKLVLCESEKSVNFNYGSKGIRFDVYVKDSDGKCFDIEIQTVNTRNLSKRARYYQSLIDADNLKLGENYNSLKESYVIFLCLFDIFGKNLPVYTFENICRQDKSVFLGDLAYKIFFNAKMYDKMPTEKLRTFFKFLLDNKESGSDFSKKLKEKVSAAKTNSNDRRRFMTWEQELQIYGEDKFQEGYDKAYSVAYKESAEETRIQNARKLKSKNVSAEIIAECTGLSVEKVREL